jgi:hypothetical protein
MLPYSCIDSMIYAHEMRVYYSVQTQDIFGKIQREWVYDRTERGMVRQINREMYMVSTTNIWDDVLSGQSEEDLRIDSNGNLYPASEVLVTFIKPKLIETAGPRKGLNTTYELRKSTPVEGPFGEVMHFDIVLTRSTTQDIELSEDETILQ